MKMIRLSRPGAAVDPETRTRVRYGTLTPMPKRVSPTMRGWIRSGAVIVEEVPDEPPAPKAEKPKAEPAPAAPPAPEPKAAPEAAPPAPAPEAPKAEAAPASPAPQEAAAPAPAPASDEAASKGRRRK